MIHITIPLIPTAQKRARHTARRTRSGKVFSQTYKDDSQEMAEHAIFSFLLPHRPKQPIDGPIVLGVKCFMPIPSSWSAKKTERANSGEIQHTNTPDLDNLIKNAKDCLSMMSFWRDDRQVFKYLPGTGKYYSTNPRWELTIMPWDEEKELA